MASSVSTIFAQEQFYGLITVLPMMALEFTPLDGIPAFTAPIRAALTPYWITSAEEFAAIARLSNASYGDGLAALGAALELDAPAMEALYGAAVAADYAAIINLDVGDGLLLGELPAPAGLDFAPPIDLPPEVLLASNLLPVLDQGRRNTCVAFTLVAMYQVASSDPTDLSEQFLFWACKQLDGMPDNPHGTTAEAALEALQTYGICLEQDWPYVAEPIEGNVDHAPPPANALSAALQRRIPGGRSLDATTSTAVRAALADGHPVLLGLLCYPFWKNSGQSRRAGRLRKALPGETPMGGHAVCAVGYRDNPAAPGGYVIIRNSWGTDWGSENVDKLGYGHVPYEVIDTDNTIWRAYYDARSYAVLGDPAVQLSFARQETAS